MNLTRGIDLKKIAEKMNGCSGAELKGVCTEAGMYALRERRVHVTQEDFGKFISPSVRMVLNHLPLSSSAKANLTPRTDLATAKILNKHDDKEMSLSKLWK